MTEEEKKEIRDIFMAFEKALDALIAMDVQLEKFEHLNRDQIEEVVGQECLGRVEKKMDSLD